MKCDRDGSSVALFSRNLFTSARLGHNLVHNPLPQIFHSALSTYSSSGSSEGLSRKSSSTSSSCSSSSTSSPNAMFYVDIFDELVDKNLPPMKQFFRKKARFSSYKRDHRTTDDKTHKNEDADHSGPVFREISNCFHVSSSSVVTSSHAAYEDARKTTTNNPPYLDYLKHSENFKDICRKRERCCNVVSDDFVNAKSQVLTELKCKLRENKMQIRENRGKLKQSDWNFDLIRNEWKDFREWKLINDEEDNSSFSGTSSSSSPFLTETDVSCFKELFHASNSDLSENSKTEHDLENSLDVSDTESLKRWSRKFNLPQEIYNKPYDRQSKGRASLRSYCTFSKLVRYRSKRSALVNRPLLESTLETESAVTATSVTEEHDWDSGNDRLNTVMYHLMNQCNECVTLTVTKLSTLSNLKQAIRFLECQKDSY